MQARVKTDAQIQAMRDGGRIIATIYEDLKNYVHAGMSKKVLMRGLRVKLFVMGRSLLIKPVKSIFRQ